MGRNPRPEKGRCMRESSNKLKKERKGAETKPVRWLRALASIPEVMGFCVFQEQQGGQ